MERGKRNNSQGRNQHHQKRSSTHHSIKQKPVKESKDQRPLKLYIYGSFSSDQFFTHKQNEKGILQRFYQSKRPICINDLQQFQIKQDQGKSSDIQKSSQEDSQDKGIFKIFPNPLFKKKIVSIQAGGLHSVVLTNDGKVFTFGCNDEGALGRQGQQCVPMQVQLGEKIDMISAGDNHSLFANSEKGVVYFTGNYNLFNSKGQKMLESIYKPQRITESSINIKLSKYKIQNIKSGSNFSIIHINNKIYCRGQPESLNMGRRILQRGRQQPSYFHFNDVGLKDVVDVWCGANHTIAKVFKQQSFRYFGWGQNKSGQLGIGNYDNQPYPVQIYALRGRNIVKVSAGQQFSLFLTQQNQIFVCGSNQQGQLGLGKDYEFVSSQIDPNENRNQAQINQFQLIQANEQMPQPNLSLKNQFNNSQNSGVILDNLVRQTEKVQINQVNQMQRQFNTPLFSNQNTYQAINNLVQRTNRLTIQKTPQKNPKKVIKQKNIYIKSLRKLQFPQQNAPTSPITNIATGDLFSFAFNQKTELYSFGFGTNYVLLNGQQTQEYKPFKVRNKIFKDEVIVDIQAGGQHVIYLAYEKPESQKKPQIDNSQKIEELYGQKGGKLPRKRHN